MFYFKFNLWRRSIVQAQNFIVTQILLKVSFYSHLQLFSIGIIQVFTNST